MSLQAVLFMVGFLTILFIYIYLIVLASRHLSGKISPVTYNRIEGAIILGIALGVVGMFQPWAQALYRVGFFLVLFSTLAFIVWSHIRPLGMYRDEKDLGPVEVSEIEEAQLNGAS